MKVFVLAPKENWICDRIAKEWKSSNPDFDVDKPEDADILWLLAGWCWRHIPVNLLKSKKTILTLHHIVPEKFDNKKYDEFVEREQYIDAYHVPNKITANFLAQITSKPIYVVSYWYNEKDWKPFEKSKARKQLNLPKNKFIIGSFQRDSEGNTNQPKLEKGPDILSEVISKIQDNLKKDVHVLLGGWRRSYIKSCLEMKGIEYTLKEKSDISDLRKMYSACDLYVVSSRYEGGPQAILEAAATKTPIVSRDVGIASSILSPYCIIDMPSQVVLPPTSTVEQNFENIQHLEIENHKKKYLLVFEDVLGDHKN